MIFSIDISDSIDFELTALYRLFFNQNVITPSPSNLYVVNMALGMLYDGVPEEVPSPDLTYFIETWFVTVEDHEDREELANYLRNLHGKIVSRLEFLRDKERVKQEQYEKSQRTVMERKPGFISFIRDALDKCGEEIDRVTREKADEYFHIELHEYPRSEQLYDAIRSNEVADFYFLKCQQEFSLKAAFITECIRHQDYQRAEQLVERLLQTAKYPSFYDMRDMSGRWRGYSWEWEVKNVMEGVLEFILRKIENEYEPPLSAKDIDVVKALTARIIPVLKKDAFPVLKAKYATLCNEDSIERQEYISYLLNDIRNYSKSPRPYGTDVNMINSEILDSFKTLDRMWEPEVLVEELLILEAAGDNLTPINFCRHMERCISQISERMTVYLVEHHPELIEKWLSKKPLERYVDKLKEMIDNCGNEKLKAALKRIIKDSNCPKEY